MKHLGLGAAMLAASVLAACEKPKDEATEKDVAPAATEKDVAPAAVEEVTTEETIVVPPTAAEEDAVMEGVTVTSPMVSEDAPKLPHKGEPPSPNQPQPVVPEEPAAKPEGPAAEEDAVMEGVTVTSPMVSEDAPKLPHKGEPPSPNQPQPVYPDSADAGEPAAVIVEEAEAVMTTPEGKTVVISEEHVTIVVPPTVAEDAPTAPHKGEAPSPNQPQPVYPDGL
jgi:cytochrome c